MFNIRVASQMTGIPPVTIRAWETRYHAVSPRRSPGGHRLYSQKDVEDLSWLKKQVDVYGLSISQAVQLLHKRKDHPGVRQVAEVLSEEKVILDELRNQLYMLDSQKTHAILDRAFAMFPIGVVGQRIIFPFLVEVGERWSTGEITVAQEHFMSQLVSQRFWQLNRMFELNHSMPKTLALCPLGEEHQIGLMMFSSFLRRHGVDVVFLGANTPLEGLRQLVESLDIERVVLSVTMDAAIESANLLIEDLALFHRRIQFFIGGTASASERLDSRFVRVGQYEDEWKSIFEKHWHKQVRKSSQENRRMFYET